MAAVQQARRAAEEQLRAVQALPAAYLRQAFPQPGQPLPAGWRRVRLGEVCEFLDSQRKPVNDKERQQRIAGKSQESLYPYYGANGQVGWIDNYLFDEPLILLAEDGGYFGSRERTIAYKINGKTWVNNHAHVLRIKNADIRYVNNYLNFTDLRDYTSGTTRGKLNKSDLERIVIPIPPLPVQQKIGDILSSIDEAIQKTDQIIQKIESFNRGVIAQLLGNSASQIVKLNTICSKITDGTHRTPKYLPTGVPFLRINDIQSDQIDWSSCKHISAGEHNELIKRCKPEKGDVLLSKNGTIGITKVVNWDKEFSIFVSLCLIKPNRSKVFPEYLAEVVGSEYVMDQVRKRSKQGTVTNLHLEEIRDFDIPLPDIDRQEEVVSVVRVLKLKKRNEEITHQTLVKLKNGIMKDVFSQKVEVNLNETKGRY